MSLWPDVGRDILGISRALTYRQAETGAIPTLRFGRTLRVPTAALLTMLGLENSEDRGTTPRSDATTLPITGTTTSNGDGHGSG